MDFRDSKTESLGGDTSAVVVENGPVQYIENLKEGETHYMFYGKYMFYCKFEGERQYMLYGEFEVERCTCSMISLKERDSTCSIAILKCQRKASWKWWNTICIN